MKKIDVTEIEQVVEDNNKIVVTSHGAPDGDSIGSALALYHYLKGLGKDVSVVIPDDAPRFLHWIPGYDEINIHLNDTKHCEELMADAEVLFCLDFNALSRLFRLTPSAEASKAIKICIDHHQEPNSFPDHLLSEPGKSSTAEMIFEFICLLDGESVITKEIGTCIYTGILTDTGSFKFSSTSSDTHRVAASLIALGVNIAEIDDNIFGTAKKETVQLLGYCLSEKMVVHEEFQTAFMSLTQEEMVRFKFEKGDTEGFVNYGLTIEGVRFVAFFMEVRGIVKVSLRSIGDFNTNEFARAHFNGGGHKNASGGMSKLSIEETIEKFESLLPQYKDQLNK